MILFYYTDRIYFQWRTYLLITEIFQIPDPDRDPQILFVCRHDKHCRPRRDWWLDKKHAKRFCFYDYFANFENDLGYDV